jgi:chitinase
LEDRVRTSLLRRLTTMGTAMAVVVVGLPASAAVADDLSGERHRTEPRRVGYYTQWSNYSGFFVKNVDTSGQAARLTHINYAFGNVGPDGRCFIRNEPGQGDAWADFQRGYPEAESVDGVADTAEQPLAGNFNQLRKLKAKHRNIKVLISLGGWTWSKYISDAVLTPESRRAFVSSCIDLYIKGNLPALDGRGGPGSAAGVFDGIDLDWEWPGSPGNVGNIVRPEDKENFTKAVAEFRRQLDAYGRQVRKHYLLTAFLPANPAAIDAGFEPRKIFRDLDFATLQGYDFHGTWEPLTNQQSALRVPAGNPTTPDFSVVSTVDAWRSRGAPRSQLVVGVPYYSQGWTGITSTANNGLFQPATGPAPGLNTYRAVSALIGTDGYRVHRDTRAGHAWIFNGSTFWTLDDPAVIAQKTRYIRDNRLGGAMVWSLDGDTADGALTRALASGLGC